MSSALVSVIMPAFNAEEFIAESIRSIKNQTYSNWELIIVDDGSTDRTNEIALSFVQADNRIKYIYQTNGRQGKARNTGLRYSTGEYIAFLDADDLWLPNKLEIQVEYLQKLDADLIFSSTYIFHDKLSKNSPKICAEPREFNGLEGAIEFIHRNRILILTVLCKREAIERVNGFTEALILQNAEDYHLWLKMLFANCKLIGINETLAAYREHINSVSSADRSNMLQVVESLISLSQQYPVYKDLILENLAIRVKNNLYTLDGYRDENFYKLLNYFLTLTNRSYFESLFNIFKKFHMRVLAQRTLYFIFRYF